MKRYGTLLLTLILSIVLAGCAQEKETPPPLPAPTIMATSAQVRQQEKVTILAEGQLVAARPILPLGFASTGRLLTVTVEVGDSVAAGDLIASIDDRALQDAVAQASATLAVAQAQLAQLKAAPQPARVAALQAQVEQAEANLAAAQASRARLFVAADQAAIIEAEARVAEARRNWTAARDMHEQILLNIEYLGTREEQARLQADAARTALEAAEARLAQLQAGPNWADIQSADAGIAQAEAGLKSAQAQLDQLLAGPTPEEIAVLQAQLAQAELNLENAQQATGEANLFAPWAGIVLGVEAAPGVLLGAGSPVVTLLDPAELEFHTSNLSERDLGQIAPGQLVRLILKAYPNTPIEGTVKRIATQASGMLGDAATFTIVITPTSTDLSLRPGMTGRAEIAAGD